MLHSPLRVGLIGCGNIVTTYLRNMPRFRSYDVVVVSDTIQSRAEEAARLHGHARAVTPDELFADDSIEAVLSLTPPGAHAEIALRSLDAGKHIYTEKPLAVDVADARRILDVAATKNLRVACAPDTFLGPGPQTCRRLIDEGRIGTPTAALAVMMYRGPDQWHPDPEFFFKPGGGPLFDMGPYYITALINMLGPVSSVTASANTALPIRSVNAGPRTGTTYTVDTPTHIASQLMFHGGALVNLVTSFDVWAHTMPCIEVHGTDGSLHVPDPNGFGGPVRLYTPQSKAWIDIPLSEHYADNARGLGLSDMASGIRLDQPHRANGAMAFHVLDVMQAILVAADTGRSQTITSTCQRPEPVPEGWAEDAWLSSPGP